MSTTPYSLQQLRILKAIANENSFTKAAEVLYLSQPYLSKQLKNLEKSLGVKLINRTSNKISLTKEGEIFLSYSDRILSLCEESCRVLIDLQNVNKGNLIIGASQTTGTYLMPKILTSFFQNYPQINLNMEVNSTNLLLKQIINEQVDLAIVDEEIPKKYVKKLKIEIFFKNEIQLIVSKSNPFGKKKQVYKDDLYNLKFVTLNSDLTTRKFLDKLLEQKNIKTNELNVIMEFDSIEAIKRAVSLDNSIGAFVSAMAIDKELNLQIVKVENMNKINQNLLLVSNLESYKSDSFHLFYNELVAFKKIYF